MSAPGLMIAATRSGSGKTMLTLGLMRALGRRGLRVAGRKNGPDYIDPAFHAAVTGRPSYNLDSWSMPEALLKNLAEVDGADIVVCEGSMGLFDGVPAGNGQGGSSADVAALTGWPVVMVHDCSGQSQSAAAILAGCAAYDPRIRVAGVILNRIASERHRRLVSDAMARVGMPVLGSVPRTDLLVLPERHLGLVQAGETGDLETRVEAAADVVTEHVDLDALLRVVRILLPTGEKDAALTHASLRGRGTIPSAPLRPPGNRIAIARDAAFSFLYPTSSTAGAPPGRSFVSSRPSPTSHPRRTAMPAGCPAATRSFTPARSPRRRPSSTGCGPSRETGPCMASAAATWCWGRGSSTPRGPVTPWPACSASRRAMRKRRLHLGYRDAVMRHDGALGPAGTRLRGHEFHYASVLDLGGDEAFAEATDAYGAAPAPTGSRRGCVTGTFFHAIAEQQPS